MTDGILRIMLDTDLQDLDVCSPICRLPHSLYPPPEKKKEKKGK